MKPVEWITPNYAPVYAVALYPELAKIFQKHGYALAVHGSLGRDFDLIAIPWGDVLSTPEEILKEITNGFTIRQIGESEARNYGRRAYTISIGHGECALDLSFFPDTEEQPMTLHELTQRLEVLDTKRKEHVTLFNTLNKQIWHEGFSLYWDDENERYCVYPVPTNLIASEKKHDQ